MPKPPMHTTSTNPVQLHLLMYILLGDDMVYRGHTKIRFSCAHEHSVLRRRTCICRGLRHNLSVKYTIVHIYFLSRRYKILPCVHPGIKRAVALMTAVTH